MVSAPRPYEGNATITWESRDGLRSILRFEGESGHGIEAEVTFVSNDGLHKYDLVQESQNQTMARAGNTFTMLARAYRHEGSLAGGDVDEISFQLVNFPHYFWVTGEGASSADPIIFMVGDWHIQIAPPINGIDRSEGVRTRGYLTTNSATVTNSNGQFKLSEWVQVEEFLTYVLTFCSGYWCPPVHIEAILNGNPVWRDFSVQSVGHLRPKMSWVPYPYPHELQSLFVGAWSRKQDQDKWDATKRAIEWHLDVANLETEAEVRVVHSQLVLELLSWVSLVEEGQILSVDGFGKLPAMDKISMLANWVGMPAHIPATYTRFLAANPQNPWANAAEGLAFIRNKLVHPTKKNRAAVANIDSGASHEAANWALSLIELTILKQLGYVGVFDDRTNYWSEEFPTVPWAPRWQKPG